MKSGWERLGEAMVGWCGYALLVPPTIFVVAAGPRNLAWQAGTLAIVAAAAAWIYLTFTRLPPPRHVHRLRVGIFFVGLMVLASLLMLRSPIFFIFLISGFFYATILRPLPLAFVGVFATSFLINTLIAGFPQTAEAWTFYVAIIAIQTVVIGGGSVVGEKVAEQNEERQRALTQLEAALVENAGLHAQLLTQAREAGILDERARMAREIHDTIAQGLIGIVTQLEAAEQAQDPAGRSGAAHRERASGWPGTAWPRRADRWRPRCPRHSSRPPCPTPWPSWRSEWSALNGIPAEVSVTGNAIAAASGDRGRAAADRPGGAGERRDATRARPGWG